MKIKKGTLVLLLNQGLFGSRMPTNASLRRCLRLVEGTGSYDFGKGFQVESFLGNSFVFRKNQIVGLVQVEPSFRKLGIRKIIERYHHSIISRFAKGILILNEVES